MNFAALEKLQQSHKLKLAKSNVTGAVADYYMPFH
jgi:hypothetical protein